MKKDIFSQKHTSDILPFSAKGPFVFLETERFDAFNYRSFIFNHCRDVLIFKPQDDAGKFFDRIEKALKRKMWLAGYFSYEFGYFLEEKLFRYAPPKTSFPLVWLGVFDAPLVVNSKSARRLFSESAKGHGYKISSRRPKISKEKYNGSIAKIKRYIEKGETYQVNFTFKLNFDFKGDDRRLYLDLCRRQPTSYMAFIDTGKDSILSFSPELFFYLKGNKIIVKPMKGTESRSVFAKEDRLKSASLRKSVKDRAENLMIVDLLRNDLGKIAKKGTVKTKRLFSVEKYQSVYQMTSTIEAFLKKDTGVEDLFRALFPSGSVTGAPKIRTMQIIKRLEQSSRGPYCGAIGYFSPHNEACFNVAIRTIYLRNKKKANLGIGGGIVYDSIDEKEHREALLKADFLTKKIPKVCLIETIRYTGKEGYYLINLHLKRLKNSCEFFNIPYCRKKIQAGLFSLRKFLDEDTAYRVRLKMPASGKVVFSFLPLDKHPSAARVILSDKVPRIKKIYLYHKTTHRYFYDRQRKIASLEGFWDIIFANKNEELTEGAVTNLFIRKNKELYTPACSSGLLPGVLREHLLITKKATEKVLYRKDLIDADEVFVGNSLRGLIRVEAIAGLKARTNLRGNGFLI